MTAENRSSVSNNDVGLTPRFLLTRGKWSNLLWPTCFESLRIIRSFFSSARARLGLLRVAHQRAEVSLRQNRAIFEELFEDAPDAILVVDRAGRIVRVNKQAAEMFGYEGGELLDQSIEVLVPERGRDRHVACRAAYFSMPGRRPMRTVLELFGRRKDGSEVPVDIALSPAQTAEGKLVLATVRDITNRSQAEMMLKVRARQQMVVAELGQYALATMDLSMLMQKAVSLVAQTLGVEYCKVLELLPDRHVLLLRAGVGWKQGYVGQVTVDARRDSQAGYTLQSNEPVIVHDLSAETRFRGPRLLLEHGVVSGMSVIIHGKDKPFGILGTHTTRKIAFTADDAHFLQSVANVLAAAIQRKRAEDQTERNLQRIQTLRLIDQAISSTLDLRTALDKLLEKIDQNLPYSAMTLRLFNGESGELEAAACRNLDEQEWMARKAGVFAKTVLESRAPLAVPDIQRIAHTRKAEFFLQRGFRSYLGVPLIAKDQALGVLSLYTNEPHDFDYREVEFLSTLANHAAIAIQNSQLYEKAETANRVKSEFLSVMSHELRTPLTAVMGYAGLIKDKMFGEINPEQEKILEKVMLRSNDLLGLINGILQATQVEADQTEVDRQEVDLVDFLNSLRSAYDFSFRKELSVIWDCPSHLPAMETDGGKLRHVLGNLIDNAVKFTQKGTVTISVRTIQDKFPILSPECLVENSEGKTATGEIAKQETGTENSTLKTQNSQQFVEFRVADTGVGIPQEKIPIIFEMFRQLDSSETRLYGGVGLGLYMVKKFTKLLGGTVEVQSEPGRGSTFIVRLPFRKLPRTNREPDRSSKHLMVRP
ncbi:MAG: GAF domain-containing protein [Deltaproteobacteria bacterium]|nr:GAF domain-containing protein [Deltaproteobacteria bacterium]